MQLSIQDTLTRKQEPLEPMDGSTFRFYCCGPTVYGPAHIGNLRTFVVQDFFRRLLEFFGTSTCHVRNITDVDDKTIRESQKAGMSLEAFTSQWHQRFQADCAALGILPPHVEPSAVAHLEDQIRLIEKLMQGNHAYQAEDGSVYYRIASFPEYGKLSGLKAEGMRANASNRLNLDDEYDKESWQDFALWKAWKPEDGPNRWESPWGPGRPGWHIECSAMSMRYLGESFDLHSGGIDLIFPHHENEIAQSEAATGKTFSKHWFHVAHLRVDGTKMSKSLGNLYTLEDVTKRGFSPAELRYLLLSGHYRQSLNFTWEGLAAARTALKRILAHLTETDPLPDATVKLAEMETSLFQPVVAALCEDLNTAKALGVLHGILNRTELSPEGQRDLRRLLRLWGLPDQPEEKVEAPVSVPSEIEDLGRRRFEARAAKRWDEADELRQAIQAKGWQVKDAKETYELRPLENGA